MMDLAELWLEAAAIFSWLGPSSAHPTDFFHCTKHS